MIKTPIAMVMVSPSGSRRLMIPSIIANAMQVVRNHQASALTKLKAIRKGQRMKRMHDMYTTRSG